MATKSVETTGEVRPGLIDLTDMGVELTVDTHQRHRPDLSGALPAGCVSLL